MSSIVKKVLSDGRIAFYAKYRELDGTQATRKIRVSSDEEANARLAVIEQRVADGHEGIVRPKPKPAPIEPRVPSMTVRELCTKYHGEAQPDTWNLSTYRRDYWSDYQRNVDPYIGDKLADTLKRTDVAAWRDKMKADGKSARTIIRGLGVLSVAFNWALELGHLPDYAHNPVEGVTKPSYRPTREIYKTEEVAALLETAARDAPDMYAVVAFAYFTGCRVGEIAALRWGDIDFQSHAITVHRSFKRNARKNGKPVVVGLHPHLRDILGPLAGPDDDLVFPDPRDGKMRRKYDSKGGCWGLRNLAKLAGVRHLRQPWHSFRASHATALEEAGATPSDIMRALGQSSIAVAMRYANASPRRAAERVAMISPPIVRVQVGTGQVPKRTHGLPN